MKNLVRVSILLALGVFMAGQAHAQTSTTGGVRGTISDKGTGETVVGATVVASSPALQGTQATITDESGQYYISNLPPGIYQLVVYYADAQFSRTNVLIQLGKVAKVNINIDTAVGAGETIVIEGRAPLLDQNSTKTGTTITSDYTENVPTGRTFGAVLGAAAGSQDDLYGTSISGSSSVENTYIVEGINTTDPGFGLLSTNLPNEFIQETEVITGGYNAEYGRSTGGVINVITKSGSNEFHGSVFAYWTPGFAVAEEKEIARAGSSISRQDDLANSFDVGAEVGGPIIKDKLWFHAGINPSFAFTDVNRIVQTQVDENGDGVPDLDENGFTQLEEVDRDVLDERRATYYYTAKLTGAVTPDHQGSLALMGNPTTQADYVAVTGVESAMKLNQDRNVFDIAGKWTSKFLDNKTQVDAVVGVHRDTIDQSPGFADAGLQSRTTLGVSRPLTTYDRFEQAFGGVPDECVDGGPGDDYDMITNCPVEFYRLGGIGALEDTEAQRLSGLLSVTQRVDVAGHHVFKAGVDVEQMNYNSFRQYTGGTFFDERPSTVWLLHNFYTPETGAEQPCGIDLDGDGVPEADCRRITGNEELGAETTTRNLGAYLQDSWSILPNLTLNAGLRWEQQTLYTAEHIQGEISPTTGDPIPDVALELKNMFAPRVGVVYDWTQEGRSKVYGHYGRFYESIPMDLNIRGYGGEVINIDVLSSDALAPITGVPASCDPLRAPQTCDENASLLQEIYFGGGETLFTPNMGGQYLDEIVLGTDYEILADLKIGAAYIRRDLGQVIEDVSTDGATTYILANPGEVDEGAIADLRAQAMAETDPNRAAFLNFQADSFEAVGLFDKPKRTYNALQLTAERRFTQNFFAQVSYTYSSLRGNYPGLFSPETTQLDPNITSMYDLPELMANRYGDLAFDRPHLVKLDGAYRLPVEDVGFFTFGGRIRASSGVPINALGAHPVYGLGESYVLPRGESGRTGLFSRFDVHVAYGRNLAEKRRVEAFVDVFNMFNQQPELSVEQDYTFDDVNPIVGGTQDDLEHLKVAGGGGVVATQNENYKNTVTRQTPLSARFGLRLIF